MSHFSRLRLCVCVCACVYVSTPSVYVCITQHRLWTHTTGLLRVHTHRERKRHTHIFRHVPQASWGGHRKVCLAYIYIYTHTLYIYIHIHRQTNRQTDRQTHTHTHTRCLASFTHRGTLLSHLNMKMLLHLTPKLTYQAIHDILHVQRAKLVSTHRISVCYT